LNDSSSDSDISISSGISWTTESSDSDLEYLPYLNNGIIPERIPRPKVNNYLAVVHEYTEEEVFCCAVMKVPFFFCFIIFISPLSSKGISECRELLVILSYTTLPIPLSFPKPMTMVNHGNTSNH
jgi:hypothetical protein